MSSYDLRRNDKGVYYIHWTDGRRSKRVSTGTSETSEAKSFFSTWLLTEPGQDSTKFTMADLWGVYWAKHIEPETVYPRTTEVAWKNLKPFFGALTIGEITNDKAKDYLALRVAGKIGRPSVPGTVRRELSLLQSCLHWCAHDEQRIIRSGDVPSIRLPPACEPRDRWLRLDDIQKLLKAAAELRDGDRLSQGERFLWLAIETAARKTAISELTWDRVDLEIGVIYYGVPGRQKTKKRRASPPISKALRPILERAYKERINDYVLDDNRDMWRIVHAVAKRAGVADVSPHVLRHTAATLMARRGVPLWKIAGILGNSMAMVEKVYAKHSPDGLADAVEMISNGVLEAAE